MTNILTIIRCSSLGHNAQIKKGLAIIVLHFFQLTSITDKLVSSQQNMLVLVYPYCSITIMTDSNDPNIINCPFSVIY